MYCSLRSLERAALSLLARMRFTRCAGNDASSCGDSPAPPAARRPCSDTGDRRQRRSENFDSMSRMMPVLQRTLCNVTIKLATSSQAALAQQHEQHGSVKLLHQACLPGVDLRLQARANMIATGQIIAHPRRSALLPERSAAAAVVAAGREQRAGAASGAGRICPAPHIVTCRLGRETS